MNDRVQRGTGKMTILYYFRKLNTPMYMWQIYHIVDELAHYNCRVDVFNPDEYDSVDEANEKVIKKLQTTRYDLFMTCHNESLLYPMTLQQIKKAGIPTVLFCPDNLVVPFNHQRVAPLFDLVWLTSHETEYLFKRWGCKTVVLPYAANPFFLKPNFQQNERLCVGFIGTPHGSRIDRINKMLDSGIPLCVHTKADAFAPKLVSAPISSYLNVLRDSIRYPIGVKLAYASVIDKLKHRNLHTDSPYLHRENVIPLEELANKNCEYALVLAFTEANSTGVLRNPVPIVNLRNFEIPMSGGLQITRYTDELASYFENDKEIILCKDDEEFKEKALFYLEPQNDTLRLKMKIAARERAEKEHTWMRRFEVAFHELGLKG